MLHLATATDETWAPFAVDHIDEILLEQAHLEKKAAADVTTNERLLLRREDVTVGSRRKLRRRRRREEQPDSVERGGCEKMPSSF